MAGVNFTAVETGITAIGVEATACALGAVAFETGIAIGSLAKAAIDMAEPGDVSSYSDLGLGQHWGW